MAWRHRWLAVALAMALLVGLAIAGALALRSPEPASAPPIELETDDQGRVRPTERTPRVRNDVVPRAPSTDEVPASDDGDDHPDEPPYHDSKDPDDGPDGSDDIQEAPASDLGGNGGAEVDDGGEVDD